MAYARKTQTQFLNAIEIHCILYGIHYVHIDPCQLRNCNYVIGEYACAKYLGVGKNDCVNTKHERVIVNTKRKQVILRSKLLQFKVIQINLFLLSGDGGWTGL